MFLRLAECRKPCEPVDVTRGHRPSSVLGSSLQGTASYMSVLEVARGFRVSLLHSPQPRGSLELPPPNPRNKHRAPDCPSEPCGSQDQLKGHQMVQGGCGQQQLSGLMGEGVLCLLAILPAFTLSLPKNDSGEVGS